jgi:hypothetical protein
VRKTILAAKAPSFGVKSPQNRLSFGKQTWGAIRESGEDQLWKDCEATILNLPFDLLPEISYRLVTLFFPNRVIGSEHKVKSKKGGLKVIVSR